MGFSIEYIQTYEGEYDENDDTKVEGIDTEEVFMADERIDMIANHIINHHSLKTRNGKYTSIFATMSIPQLVKYYDTFMRLKKEGKEALTIQKNQLLVEVCIFLRLFLYQKHFLQYCLL